MARDRDLRCVDEQRNGEPSQRKSVAKRNCTEAHVGQCQGTGGRSRPSFAASLPLGTFPWFDPRCAH